MKGVLSVNIPMSWLKQYVDLDCTINEFVDEMTLSGSKVESVQHLGQDISNIIIGKIKSIAKHPDADKLVVCQVDIGKPEPIQIVTAATNVFEGATIPVAVDGATVAGGKKIKKGKLRGQLSDGMMCSIEELGYTLADFPEAEDDGIYIFKEEQPLGADVRPILELLDDVVEFEITSNRPDCFSVIGIAREAAATFCKPLKYPDIQVREEAGGKASDFIAVEILNPELCPRYVARVVKNVKIEPSPQWMRRRLTSAGLRPINNIVDITNYVMLELGQPMHAFDIDNIDERKIIVRNAVKNEVFTTLDGVKRELDENMLVIADCNKAVAIAGVMGGENSKVTEHASAILFESANFKGANVRQTSKKLGLRTDASGKFEKGLDPNLSLEAVNRAVQLVEELGCGEVVSGYVDCYPNKRESRQVNYSAENINKLLGTEISAAEMETFLARLEIKASNGTADIPTFRPDIEREADLAEEVARLFGYDKIEPTLAAGTPTVGRLSNKQYLEDLTRSTMVSLGLCESMSYAFESPKVLDKLSLAQENPLRRTVKILNPLGEDFSIMRTSTLNGMLGSLSTNYNRRNEEAKLFEMGKVYLPKQLPLNELPDEPNMLTIGMYGNTDFYDLKGILEELYHILGIEGVEYTPEPEISYLHPGRSAAMKVTAGEETIALGYMGEVHPAVAARYEIGKKSYVAVINLDAAFSMASLKHQYKPLPKFPGMQRDISILIAADVMVKDIETIIRERGGKSLEGIQLFDVYTGKQVQDGFKSVAYKILFRAPDRTLTDDEVSKAMKKILDALQEKLDAKLRS